MLLEALDKDVIEQTPDSVLLPVPRHLREGRGPARPVRPGVQQGVQGHLTDYGQNPVDIPEDWLKAVAEKFLTPEEMAAIKKLVRLGRDHGDAQEAARGTAEAPRGRQQVDRHRRHLARSATTATTPKASASAAKASTSAR
jgi:hypothetical protein